MIQYTVALEWWVWVWDLGGVGFLTFYGYHKCYQ